MAGVTPGSPPAGSDTLTGAAARSAQSQQQQQAEAAVTAYNLQREASLRSGVVGPMGPEVLAARQQAAQRTAGPTGPVAQPGPVSQGVGGAFPAGRGPTIADPIRATNAILASINSRADAVAAEGIALGFIGEKYLGGSGQRREIQGILNKIPYQTQLELGAKATASIGLPAMSNLTIGQLIADLWPASPGVAKVLYYPAAKEGGSDYTLKLLTSRGAIYGSRVGSFEEMRVGQMGVGGSGGSLPAITSEPGRYTADVLRMGLANVNPATLTKLMNEGARLQSITQEGSIWAHPTFSPDYQGFSIQAAQARANIQALQQEAAAAGWVQGGTIVLPPGADDFAGRYNAAIQRQQDVINRALSKGVIQPNPQGIAGGGGYIPGEGQVRGVVDVVGGGGNLLLSVPGGTKLMGPPAESYLAVTKAPSIRDIMSGAVKPITSLGPTPPPSVEKAQSELGLLGIEFQGPSKISTLQPTIGPGGRLTFVERDFTVRPIDTSRPVSVRMEEGGILGIGSTMVTKQMPFKDYIALSQGTGGSWWDQLMRGYAGAEAMVATSQTPEVQEQVRLSRLFGKPLDASVLAPIQAKGVENIGKRWMAWAEGTPNFPIVGRELAMASASFVSTIETHPIMTGASLATAGFLEYFAIPALGAYAGAAAEGSLLARVAPFGAGLLKWGSYAMLTAYGIQATVATVKSPYPGWTAGEQAAYIAPWLAPGALRVVGERIPSIETMKEPFRTGTSWIDYIMRGTPSRLDVLAAETGLADTGAIPPSTIRSRIGELFTENRIYNLKTSPGEPLSPFDTRFEVQRPYAGGERLQFENEIAAQYAYEMSPAGQREVAAKLFSMQDTFLQQATPEQLAAEDWAYLERISDRAIERQARTTRYESDVEARGRATGRGIRPLDLGPSPSPAPETPWPGRAITVQVPREISYIPEILSGERVVQEALQPLMERAPQEVVYSRLGFTPLPGVTLRTSAGEQIAAMALTPAAMSDLANIARNDPIVGAIAATMRQIQQGVNQGRIQSITPTTQFTLKDLTATSMAMAQAAKVTSALISMQGIEAMTMLDVGVMPAQIQIPAIMTVPVTTPTFEIPQAPPPRVPTIETPWFPLLPAFGGGGAPSWGRMRGSRFWKEFSPMGLDVAVFGPWHVPELRGRRALRFDFSLPKRQRRTKAPEDFLNLDFGPFKLGGGSSKRPGRKKGKGRK